VFVPSVFSEGVAKMARVRGIATARFRHEGKNLFPGVEFDADEGNLDDLRALGFAMRKVVEAEPVQDREEGEHEEEERNEEPAPRARYRRRDVKAGE
jgi:hypothetical protein